MLLFILYCIFGLRFPEAVIRGTDFFIHTTKFWKLKNWDYLQRCYRYTIKINLKELSCILREWWYCFTNNASGILILYVLLLYPMLKNLKFSMLTVSWLEFKPCLTIITITCIAWSITRSLRRLAVSPI